MKKEVVIPKHEIDEFNKQTEEFKVKHEEKRFEGTKTMYMYFLSFVTKTGLIPDFNNTVVESEHTLTNPEMINSLQEDLEKVLHTDTTIISFQLLGQSEVTYEQVVEKIVNEATKRWESRMEEKYKEHDFDTEDEMDEDAAAEAIMSRLTNMRVTPND